jgi:steroid delta-isomerase-like uncharacterized protein
VVSAAPADTTPPPAPPKPSLADLEKKAISDWYAAFNAHDTAKLAVLYAPDAVEATTGPGGWHETKGGEAIAALFAPLFAALPDVKGAPSRVLQKNDKLVVEWAAAGTNTSEFMGGPATNKPSGVYGATVITFTPDGLILREEMFHDQATVAQQLGKMPGKAREVAKVPTGDAVWITATGTPDEDKLVDTMKGGWPVAWTKHDVKAYGALIGDDTLHVAMAGAVDFAGRDAMINEFQMYLKSFPDMAVTVGNAWGFAPGIVVADITFTGTMKAALGAFKATNKPVTVHNLEIDESKDGKPVKGTTYANGMELLSELGVLPKAPKEREKAAKVKPAPDAAAKAEPKK